MAGTSFTGPLKIKKSDGTKVTIADADGNLDAPVTTTDLTASGSTTLGDAASDVQTLNGVLLTPITTTSSGAGAVAITGTIHEVTTTGTGDALTLADGTEGQRLVVGYVAEGAGGDTAILTPSNFGGGTTITFNALGDAADLIFTNGNWYMIGGTAAVA